MLMTLTIDDIVYGDGCINKDRFNDCDARIYFLSNKGSLVYVGKTINLSQRVLFHNKDKDFDRITYIKVPVWRRDFIEAYYIHKLNPTLNNEVPSKGIYKTSSSVRIEYEDLARAKINEVISKNSKFKRKNPKNKGLSFFISSVEERKIRVELNEYFKVSTSDFIKLGE